jgi:hypothetical protein
MKLSFSRVDRFVEVQQELGNDVRWDGWTMIFFRQHRGGFFKGVHRNGTYGFETRVEADDKGFWNVPPSVIV